MKDAKGHGSDPRGAHSAGVDQVGRVPIQPGIWYHGSPLGEPGVGPIHVGTQLAAKQALESRIGIPADGKGWDGTREYGKTLLAGQDTLKKLGAAAYNGGFPESGYNAFNVPKEDYYATDRTSQRATMGRDNTPVPFDARPAVRAYEIAGNMSNNTFHPTTDTRANGMQRRLKNVGTYYKEDGEDSGSVAAVVPTKDFLRRVR